MKGQVEWISPTAITPYEKNARINDAAVPLVRKSIESFGFQSPIIVDRNHVIICGHTRHKAALEMGLEAVPVIVASDLSDEQVKAYRLADNKVSEAAKWDTGLLLEELNDLTEFADCDMSAFGFDLDEITRQSKRAAWRHLEKRCDLKKKVKAHAWGDSSFLTMFEVGKAGKSIAEIKENVENVPLFADCLTDLAWSILGQNLSAGSWCLVTAPRRRHKEGLHFATAICEKAAVDLHVPFYADCITAEDRGRIEPHFDLVQTPRETNCLLYDDILTTGATMKAMRRLLQDAGKCTLSVASIKN